MKQSLLMKKILIAMVLIMSVLVFEFLLNQSSVLSTISNEIYKARIALMERPFSEKSVWDQKFLAENPIIKEKIQNFESGKICSSLKILDNKTTSYEEMDTLLKQAGYEYRRLPLLVDPNAKELNYYLKNGSTTLNKADPDILYQEIYAHPEGCVVRIKTDGIPYSMRPKPHSIKAVLIDPNSHIYYENEAFKVTWDGKPVPKGPLFSFGLKAGLSSEEQQKRLKSPYVDYIMKECHPELNF